MKTRKLRRTGPPCRYGALEVATGDVVDIPPGVAAELVDGGEGWEFLTSPRSEPADPAPAATASTVSRRKKSGESDS